MALASTLNFYTHQQLATYAYETINGTVYFSVLVTLTYTRNIISGAPTFNISGVDFVSTSDIDKWECRATLPPASHNVGVGLLISSGSSVSGGSHTTFDVNGSQLIFGDGQYRIDIYVNKNGVWYGDGVN